MHIQEGFLTSHTVKKVVKSEEELLKELYPSPREGATL